jgi:hypothetical protein
MAALCIWMAAAEPSGCATQDKQKAVGGDPYRLFFDKGGAG